MKMQKFSAGLGSYRGTDEHSGSDDDDELLLAAAKVVKLSDLGNTLQYEVSDEDDDEDEDEEEEDNSQEEKEEEENTPVLTPAKRLPVETIRPASRTESPAASIARARSRTPPTPPSLPPPVKYDDADDDDRYRLPPPPALPPPPVLPPLPVMPYQTSIYHRDDTAGQRETFQSPVKSTPETPELVKLASSLSISRGRMTTAGSEMQLLPPSRNNSRPPSHDNGTPSRLGSATPTRSHSRASIGPGSRPASPPSAAHGDRGRVLDSSPSKTVPTRELMRSRSRGLALSQVVVTAADALSFVRGFIRVIWINLEPNAD